MTARTVSLFFLALVAALALGFFGYYLYDRFISFSQTINHDAMRAQEIADNRTRTLEALTAAGVSAQQATRGFWYTYKDRYGNESVAYFDGDKWSQQEDLTDRQIQDLAARVKSAGIADRSSMKDIPTADLPPTLQFHNQLYSEAQPGVFESTQARLENLYKKGTATKDQLWELSYMYELQGEYSKRDAVSAVSCKKYQDRCKSDVKIALHGQVVDLAKRPIEGASVSVLSHPELKVALTDAKGAFSILVSAKEMEKIRLSAVKRNFSQGVESAVIIGGGKRDYDVGEIVLGSPISIVTIDTQKHTITDPNDEAHADGSFVVHTPQSTYEIPAGAIVHADGTAYRGQVDIYLYEFNRDTIPENLATLDTFDQVVGYAGDIMKSFGMPYIQFFTPEGEELDVRKSKSMTLTYRVYHINDVLEGSRGYYEAVTPAEMELLVAASKGQPYRIDRAFLIKNDLVQFPAWWVFDRKRGVWDNVGMSILDTSGTIQVPFYTMRDDL